MCFTVNFIFYVERAHISSQWDTIAYGHSFVLLYKIIQTSIIGLAPQMNAK